MVNFNPDVWLEVSNEEEFEVPAGRLQVRVSAPSALYLVASGAPVLAGVDTSFDLRLAEHSRGVVIGQSGIRIFVLTDPDASALTIHEDEDAEVFTNIDRMPSETGVMAEVLRATRQLELKKREMLAEMRELQEQLDGVVPLAELDKAYPDDPDNGEQASNTAVEGDGDDSTAST